MGETFDERTRRQSAEIAAEMERERAYREQAGREAAIAWERLKAILRGERPTRESNAVWAAQRGMLPMPPARTFDGNFDTVLTEPEEVAFQQWKRLNAPRDSGADYDLRGAFKAGLIPGANAHWSDEFKKPNHPTFSDQSQYAPYGNPGHWAGQWDPTTRTYTPPEGKDVYTPGVRNVQNAISATRPTGMLPYPPRPFSPDADYVPSFVRG